MLLAVLRLLGFDILLRDAFPVPEAALRDTLEQKNLFARRPLWMKQRKLQIVQDHVVAD